MSYNLYLNLAIKLDGHLRAKENVGKGTSRLRKLVAK